MSKIVSTNFAHDTYVGIGKLRVVFAVAALFLLCLLIYLLIKAQYHKESLIQLDEKTTSLELEYDYAEKAASVLPEYQVMQELGRKVELVNELVTVKGDNTVSLLTEIEEILPKNALLTQFQHKPKIGEIDLTVKSKDTLALTAFVHELEANKKFQQVLIRRQSHDNEEADATSYDIRIIQ